MVSKWWHEYQVVVEVVVVDDASVAKMSGGDVDVQPYLDSRNTKGYGTATQILKPRSGNTCWSVKRAQWWWYAEVLMVYKWGRQRCQTVSTETGWGGSTACVGGSTAFPLAGTVVPLGSGRSQDLDRGGFWGGKG